MAAIDCSRSEYWFKQVFMFCCFCKKLTLRGILFEDTHFIKLNNKRQNITQNIKKDTNFIVNYHQNSFIPSKIKLEIYLITNLSPKKFDIYKTQIIWPFWNRSEFCRIKLLLKVYQTLYLIPLQNIAIRFMEEMCIFIKYHHEFPYLIMKCFHKHTFFIAI